MKLSFLVSVCNTLLAGLIVILGGWDKLLLAIIVFALIDYLTGIMAAAITGKLNSKTGAKGILKKLVMFAVIAAGTVIDQCGFYSEPYVRSLFILFYLGVEGTSIIENADEAGVPVPAPFKSALEQIRTKGEGNQ